MLSGIKVFKVLGEYIPNPFHYRSRHCFRIIFLTFCLLLAGLLLFSLMMKSRSKTLFLIESKLNRVARIHEISTSNKKNLTRSLLGAIKLTLPVGKALHDDSRLVNIYYFVWTGNNWERLQNVYDICIAIQTSLDRIFWLPEVLQNWDAPLSLSVYITNEEDFLILNLFWDFFERCYPSCKKQVALHIAIPALVGGGFTKIFMEDYIKNWAHSSNLTFLEIKYNNTCKNAKQYLRFLMKTFPVLDPEKLAMKEVYPQNHMRNIARRGCGTDWLISTDVDLIPSVDMAQLLQRFYENLRDEQEICKKFAFVIPTFELEHSQPFPKNKKEIASYRELGYARPFHEAVFLRGHNATNYKLWLSSYLEDEEVQISHPITPSATYLYEPFYISSATIPQYDERFLGYGRTRSAQFQEALYAGWNFTVLTPVYFIHWGLQTKSTLLSPKKGGTGENVRKRQTANNIRLFHRYLKELELKRDENLF